MYMGVLCPPPIIIGKVEKFFLIYKEHQGNFDLMKDVFMQMTGILKSLSKEDTYNLTPVCVVWDDPKQLIDLNKGRWCVGVKLDDITQKAAIDLLKKVDYKTIELPACQSVTTTHVIRNFLSYFLISWAWGRFVKSPVWSGIKDYNNITAVEFCPKLERSLDNRIHMHLLTGESKMKYLFCSLPEPKKK